MSDYTSTRAAIQSAGQKANDAYALCRRIEEQLRGAVERIDLLTARVRELETAPVIEPVRPRRKAA
jgi:hypothetical protein